MSNDVAMVTGGATGIGAATASRLADAGLKVVICDVNANDGEPLAARLNGTFLHCDVTDLESVTSAVERCAQEVGRPRFAHLNAGIMTVPTGNAFLPIEQVEPAQYRRILGVNLDGVFHGMKALLPTIRDLDGAITVTASIAAFGLLPIDPLYSATKHALVGFVRSIAAANADASIRINAICPGVVDTAIVPDAFRDPATIMPPDEMAAEVVDLLLRAPTGDIRAKIAGHAAFTVPAIDVNALAGS